MLTFFYADAASLTVVGQLCLVDAPYGEIVSLRMIDEQTADGSRWLDRIMVGKRDTKPSLSIQQIEDNALQGVVGTSRIAESHTENMSIVIKLPL